MWKGIQFFLGGKGLLLELFDMIFMGRVNESEIWSSDGVFLGNFERTLAGLFRRNFGNKMWSFGQAVSKRMSLGQTDIYGVVKCAYKGPVGIDGQ